VVCLRTVSPCFIDAGCQVRRLVRCQGMAEHRTALGTESVLISPEDHDLLGREAQQSEGVINAAGSNHRDVIAALIKGLPASGKPLQHINSSSAIGNDALGKQATQSPVALVDMPTLVEAVTVHDALSACRSNRGKTQ
jgi:hypothetical protein